MISKNFLQSDPKLTNLRCPGLGELTIDVLREKIESSCIKHGLNVIVATDTVTSGKMFDKSKSECVTVTNAEHPTDYFVEVITLKTQGTYAFIEFYVTGNSKNLYRVHEGDKEHKSLTGSIIGAIKKATVSDDALETEQNYYEMLNDALEATFK